MRAGTLAVVALLVAAGAVGAAPAAGEATVQQNDTDATTITVSTSGQASADPEAALVSVAVVATADDAETARETVANDSSRMIAALRAAGIADESVRSTVFAIEPVYNRSTIVGFRAVQGFELTVGVGEAGLAVDVAVGNGADRVDDVTFTVDDETRRELRRTALTRAMANARADADAVATAAGLTVTGVESARTTDGGVGPIDRVAEGAPTEFRPGPVTVVAEVRVVYAAE